VKAATPEEDEVARRSADAMFERDLAARAMGIELVDVRRGYAKVAMTIRADMVNGHDIAHGGYVFALADTAFAYACNSRNHVNVALQCSISFVASPKRGDRIVAIADEEARTNRTGVYDVRVLSEPGGKVLALFRGVPYQLAATLY
jgi:acyl-CoA thioesterase